MSAFLPGSDKGLLELRVQAIRYAARDIHLVELVHPDGAELPAATPGAHIDLYLGQGLVRSYSLVEPGAHPRSYLLGVKREAASRGGSRYVHEQLRVGTTLTVSAPRNHFPLAEHARHSILIAGGIGITPIWCMAQQLEAVGASWELWYSARTRADAAFLDRFEPLFAKVHLHFDDEQGCFLDLGAVVRGAAEDTHLYCCGPTPMLDAYEAAAAQRDPRTVHLERFGAKAAASLEGGFVVALARSGKEMAVPEGASILKVLLDNGVPVDFSCQEGICGCCEVAVLEGEVDHRDAVLSESERAQGKTMMVCCSGAKSARLVLDL
ncbi:PDR/VanB family oxidoreductase [Bordetella avium]|uniref:Oxidoreductase n=1 Tax=Bordetella avium (strain 197N) TaxID=360910 RepID=Q2KXR3_BORA1|nr:PDR/VanB family oxidoreductase [Bordetella avium]AZY51551.1 oxidoreductase [Bordetella avium]RIQ14595.1 oxidoreductase [Bordetella avium]RIQ16705.1 oxidoreductase [Bordetella avium]RIQ35039.1 oxidoreductase [Bordetella avium]RIQ40941.1 oxidoreductase [Bordetella avium]